MVNIVGGTVTRWKPIWGLIRDTFNGFSRDQVTTLAAALARLFFDHLVIGRSIHSRYARRKGSRIEPGKYAEWAPGSDVVSQPA
jgi:hypothetical protein